MAKPQYSDSLIDQIKAEIYDAGLTVGTRNSVNWLLTKIKGMGDISRRRLMSDTDRLRLNTFIGGMFMFYYDPKTKDKLPYYDRFPLVIPFSMTKDGFVGLNLHYLAPRPRIALLNKLQEYASNGRLDDTTRMRFSWNMLKQASGMPEVKVCVKRYLASHCRSEFLKISADEWYIASLLPVQQFTKASAETVWKDNRSHAVQKYSVGKKA